MIDRQNIGFQCIESENQKEGFFKPLERGRDLQCVSPQSGEDFFKECKGGNIIKVPKCSFQFGTTFLCLGEKDQQYNLDLKDMDNYFCMTDQHWKRVSERCK